MVGLRLGGGWAVAGAGALQFQSAGLPALRLQACEAAASVLLSPAVLFPTGRLPAAAACLHALRCCDEEVSDNFRGHLPACLPAFTRSAICLPACVQLR